MFTWMQFKAPVLSAEEQPSPIPLCIYLQSSLWVNSYDRTYNMQYYFLQTWQTDFLQENFTFVSSDQKELN